MLPNGDMLLAWLYILGLGVAPPLALAVGGYQLFKRTELGRALLTRARTPGAAEAAQLVQELDELRHQMLELQERVDFSERLLAQITERPLPGATPETHTPV